MTLSPRRILRLLYIVIGVYLILVFVAVQVGKVVTSFQKEKIIYVVPGDILVRTNTNFAIGTEMFYWGGLTGHVGLVVKGGIFSNKDKSLGNVEVIEARLYKRNPLR